MKKWFLMLTAGMAFMSVNAIAQEVQIATEKTPSIYAAEEWLTVVDSGDYAKSWDTSSEYFRTFITKENWLETLKAVRAPLDVLISRNLVTSMPTPSLPGVPDGEYDVLTYEAVFGHKADAVETVTVKKDPDGVWRVVGYYIK